MIDETSYASDVADELELTSSAYAEDVTGAVDLTSAAYGEDVAEAINEQPVDPPVSDHDLRVCQYNIGHFNMGMEAGDLCLIGSGYSEAINYPQFFNYTTQQQRWLTRLAAINADIYGLPEYNENFGYNGSTLVSTPSSGIFDGYDLSVGKRAMSAWWQNTLASLSEYVKSDEQDIELGSTATNKAYVHVATYTIKDRQVKIGVTHLNWNNPTGANTDPAYTINATNSYNSRQKEIKTLVKMLNEWLEDYEYVILFGDFNTEGPVYGPSVSYDPSVRNYAAGLAEFAPFIDGCTVDGEAYDGGFTLANSDDRPLLTSIATNSRPDLPSRPQSPYCYIDNIIVKGFTMSNVQVIDDGTITDHCAVVCDLTFID